MTRFSDVRTPRNPSELRRALIIRRAGITRSVVVRYAAVYSNRQNTRDFDIRVHPGSTLNIVVLSGLPFLKLLSGHIEVTFESIWGNSLTLCPETTAKVIVPKADTKVTISGDDSGLNLVLPPSNKHRVYWPSKYKGGLK